MKRSLARLLLGIPLLMILAGALLILDAHGIQPLLWPLDLVKGAIILWGFVTFYPDWPPGERLILILSPLLLLLIPFFIVWLRKVWRYYFNGENA